MNLRIIFPGILMTMFLQTNAQAPDSMRTYVNAFLDTMQRHSLYADRVNWPAVRSTVSDRLDKAKTGLQAEEAIIWAYQQLKDDHGMYAGVDTTYRYERSGAKRKLSKGLLAAYKIPRAVRIKMLPGRIAYYRMPAVLVGSNEQEMKRWANSLGDSLCKLAKLNPRGFIIDLRMNNGGNLEPMWHALKNLVGDRFRPYYVDRDSQRVADPTGPAYEAYLAAGKPDSSCAMNNRTPIAVLIGPGTASSGEIIAMGLQSRPRTKFFGERSYGVANSTEGFTVQDKGYILLTTAYVADWRGQINQQMYIDVEDVIEGEDDFENPEKDEKVRAAIRWFRIWLMKS